MLAPHAGVYDEYSEACWECLLDYRTSLEAFDQVRPNASIRLKAIRDAKQSEAYKECVKDVASALVSDIMQNCGLINTQIVKVKPETPMGGTGKTDDKVY